MISVMVGTLRTVSSIRIKVGGSLRPVTIKVMRSGVLTQVHPPVTAYDLSVSPSSLSTDGYAYRPRKFTTSAASVTPTGGTAPFAYSWQIAGDQRVTANTPDMASTTFSATLYDDTASATATCTSTDSRGVTATASVDITITAYPYEGSPGGPIS